MQHAHHLLAYLLKTGRGINSGKTLCVGLQAICIALVNFGEKLGRLGFKAIRNTGVAQALCGNGGVQRKPQGEVRLAQTTRGQGLNPKFQLR